MRADFSSEPGLGDQIFELLEETFPGVTSARVGAERFGASWESVSTPFVHRDGDQIVSHVGLLSIPLMVAGRRLVAGGIHGVATRVGARRRGLFRGLMEEALDDAAGRFQTLILTTAHPEYFDRFGFRVVPESVFLAQAPTPSNRPSTRRLDLEQAEDRRLLHRQLERRAPVSAVLGIGPDKAVWAFYEASSELRYSAELDLVIVAERAGDTLRLYDLVGPAIPPLERVLGALGEPAGQVVAFFSLDRVAATYETLAHDLAGGPTSLEPGTRNGVLMARGPLETGGRPVMLPRPGRC